MNFKISYAITARNEHKALNTLINFLLDHKREEDEIVIQADKANHTQEVSDVIKAHKLKKNEFELNNDLVSFKNNLKKICKGDYIFQINEDELPAEETVRNLHSILESNIDIDLFLVPRVNIVNEITQDYIKKRNWEQNEHQWVNWPDYQHRIIKNNFNIKWENKLHETIVGAKTGVQLPSTIEYSLIRVTDVHKLETQNIIPKSKKVSLCLVVANTDDCIDRFFHWAIPRFEDIIILKSDSDDQTDQIIDRYYNEFKNQISVHYQPIKNIADQKQSCINLSEKEWKLIIDADEVLEDNDWDLQVQKLESQNIDLCFLPRYNLQKDENHFLSKAYPDMQPRLFNSRVKFSNDPMHETHHVMTGYRDSTAINDCHIIHWGHIRSESHNLWKSKMRKQYANTDLCDGEGLLSHKNWFHERNEILKYNETINSIPPHISTFIQSLDHNS
jgi:hypothetical protein